MAVPAFHPGPFKNVGSSLFPSMVQDALKEKLQCIISAPHGLSGHSLDLSSQAQNHKVIDSILDSVDFPFSESRATPLIRVVKNGARASCQMFGTCALVTLTLAPETMEDLPEALNSAIVSEAKKRGVSLALIIDAHNSIDGPFNLEKMVDPLRMAAVASLDKTSERQQRPFLVGASTLVPEDFGVEEGMGPGGISIIVTKVGAQEAAYVTIDGNNMISGLRERILSALRELGITEGEILTTDTHAVNGVVLTPRGYHPVGEAMNQAKLIECVREAATKALNNLEPAKVSWHKETVPNVKVIGEKQIEALCALTDKTAKLAKKLATTLFPVTGIFLLLLLAFV
jgi:putative membrane protein